MSKELMKQNIEKVQQREIDSKERYCKERKDASALSLYGADRMVK